MNQVALKGTHKWYESDPPSPKRAHKCFSRVMYRSSLLGGPRANAPSKPCSSRATYKTFLLGSRRANALSKETCSQESPMGPP